MGFLGHTLLGCLPTVSVLLGVPPFGPCRFLLWFFRVLPFTDVLLVGGFPGHGSVWWFSWVCGVPLGVPFAGGGLSSG